MPGVDVVVVAVEVGAGALMLQQVEGNEVRRLLDAGCALVCGAFSPCCDVEKGRCPSA
ncbi:hypothetical protein ACFQ6Q_28760 [Streptomyces sp. NPDC056437]|uniref:hypothetical protein n=1 Tax=Streptomyces sp. NPDC056437 TaxID=3345816 RepID=UPI0036A37D31